MDRRAALRTGAGIAGLVAGARPKISNADTNKISAETLRYWQAFINEVYNQNYRDMKTNSLVRFETHKNTGSSYEPFSFMVAEDIVDGICTLGSDNDITSVINPRPVGYDPSAEEVSREEKEAAACEMLEIDRLIIPDVIYDKTGSTIVKDVGIAAEYLGWGIPTGVEQNYRPQQLKLNGNFPNPFNPLTNIEFEVPQNSSPVTLTIYNRLGQEVKTLIRDQDLRPGRHGVIWQPENLASGSYYAVIKNSEISRTQKMMYAK